MEDDYKEPSVCDDCEIGDGWECHFCCNKCYEDRKNRGLRRTTSILEQRMNGE